MDRDPYAEGADAFIAGHSDLANPYDLDGEFEAHCLWNDGWSDAEDASEEG